MHVLTLTKRGATLRISSLYAIIQSDWRFGMWGLVTALTFNAVMVIYFINILFFPHALAVTTSSVPVNMAPGPGTQELIRTLDLSGLNPTSAHTMTRRYFSGSGRTITLGGDNIQAFEYPTTGIAETEMSLLSQRYADSTRPAEWKKNIHLYYSDTIAVFYLGNNKKILYALEQTAGLARAEMGVPPKSLTKVGN